MLCDVALVRPGRLIYPACDWKEGRETRLDSNNVSLGEIVEVSRSQRKRVNDRGVYKRIKVLENWI